MRGDAESAPYSGMNPALTTARTYKTPRFAELFQRRDRRGARNRWRRKKDERDRLPGIPPKVGGSDPDKRIPPDQILAPFIVTRHPLHNGKINLVPIQVPTQYFADIHGQFDGNACMMGCELAQHLSEASQNKVLRHTKPDPAFHSISAKMLPGARFNIDNRSCKAGHGFTVICQNYRMGVSIE